MRLSGDRVKLYALVIYLSEPLAGFLDQLRLEMAPDCNPRAHVSVLPPRPLEDDNEAILEVSRAVADFPAFEVELGRIDVFPVTDVIFIAIDGGAEQLRQLHAATNRGALAFDEPFPYHPHVTLAQDLDPGHTGRLRELATRRWREFQGPRSFRVETTVFVRNTHGNQWIDLAEGRLRGVLA
jgi:2'-5' RNA ligase